MTKLGALPALQVVAGYRGKIDFYYHKGIPCARRWPRWKLTRRAPAVAAAGAIFGDFATRVNALDPELRAIAATEAGPYNWTWRDYATAAAFGTVYT